jgi:5-methylcytosine-specific restriction endonuclease McrA
MTKKRLDEIKKDPKKYQSLLIKNREYWKRRFEKEGEREKVSQRQRDNRKEIKNDPIRNQIRLEKIRLIYKNKDYTRRRKQVFRRLCRNANRDYKDNKLAPISLWQIAKKQKCKCILTGTYLTIDNMSIDHIIPKSKGGLNISENIRLVIKPINIARQTMTDNELYSLCKLLVNHLGPSMGEGTAP